MTNTDEHRGHLSIGGLSRASGVPVETLRNWEKRYGFPAPVRRTSGHRRYEIKIVPRLKLIREVIEHGFKPSFAVNATEADLRIAIGGLETPTLEPIVPEGGDPQTGVKRWLVHVERLDGAGFDYEMRLSWIRLGAVAFINDLAVPFLDEIGRRWFEKELSVAHEHFASEILQGFLSAQWRPLARNAQGPRVVLAAVEGEHHALGLHIASVLLSLEDFRVDLLGPNTPIDDIVLATEDRDVFAVILGFSKASNPDRAAEALERLRRAVRSPIVVGFGGTSLIRDLESVRWFDSFEAFGAWAAREASKRRSR